MISRENLLEQQLREKEVEIERLKEYMILQNASDEVEEKKDKEIERLNKALDTAIEIINNKEKVIIAQDNIIKEVREWIGIDKELRKVCTNYDVNGIDILEILDKGNNNE